MTQEMLLVSFYHSKLFVVRKSSLPSEGPRYVHCTILELVYDNNFLYRFLFLKKCHGCHGYSEVTMSSLKVFFLDQFSKGILLFIIVDKKRHEGEDVKRCLCDERPRDKGEEDRRCRC